MRSCLHQQPILSVFVLMEYLQGHWVLKHENSLFWHHTVFKFINKYSGITPENATSPKHSEAPEQTHPMSGAIADLEGLSITSHEWTQESDLKLFIARAQGMSWGKIGDTHFPEKTPFDCHIRWFELAHPGKDDSLVLL